MIDPRGRALPGSTGARTVLAALALLALLTVTGCGGEGGEPPNQGQPSTEPRHDELPPVPSPPSEATSTTLQPLEYKEVSLYFPSAGTGLLVKEPREIFDTASPGDRAKQILSDLLEGPNDPGSLPAVPRGVMLRQVYVTEAGIAYADFSSDLKFAVRGGSMDEILTVYAIVNSLALNIEEISRVAILLEGREIDTLAGHLDLRRPLLPDRRLVAP